MNNRIIAVLGASGFLGKNFLLSMPENFATVFAFYNTTRDFPLFLDTYKVKAVPVKCDLSKLVDLRDVPRNFDIVISFLGNTKKMPIELQPDCYFESEHIALLNFFKYFYTNKLLYFSSGAVYENHRGIVSCNQNRDLSPNGGYALSKIFSESIVKYLKNRDRISSYLIVRFFGAFGQYEREDRLLTRLIKQFFLRKLNYINLTGTGENLIDIMYVKDAVAWVLSVLQCLEFRNEIVDFGTGSSISIKELVKLVAQTAGIKNLQINFDKQEPKENYHFYLGNKYFRILPPYSYKFKYSLTSAIRDYADWLIKKEETNVAV